MKRLLTILSLLLVHICSAQQPSPPDTITNPNFDAVLADKLGGDEYGMKQYFLVILKTGENKSSDKEFINENFKGHISNMQRLVKEEKLVVAGPIGSNDKSYRGIFIFQNLKNMDEANEILSTDPAIKNGLLAFEIYNWYGSAALPEYLIQHEKIWKKKP